MIDKGCDPLREVCRVWILGDDGTLYSTGSGWADYDTARVQAAILFWHSVVSFAAMVMGLTYMMLSIHLVAKVIHSRSWRDLWSEPLALFVIGAFWLVIGALLLP